MKTVFMWTVDRLSVIHQAHGSGSMGSWLSVLVNFSFSLNTVQYFCLLLAEAAL